MDRNAGQVDRLYEAIYKMDAALRIARDEGGNVSKSVAAALDIAEQVLEEPVDVAEQALKEGQNRVLDRVAHPAGRAVGPERVAHVRTSRKREQDRRRLLKLTRPEMMLAPVNVVAVFLRDQPMWPSWDWPSTQTVNARMLPFLQGLNPDDPPPDDARLALPLTIAGFMMYRALHLGPQPSPSVTKTLKDDPGVVVDVYAEIAQGVVILDKCFTDAAWRQTKGEVSEAFLSKFFETTKDAELLLLHAIRLGPDMWRLILRCGLGAECRLDEPFYVTEPGGPRPHGRCLTYKSRKKRTKSRKKRTM